MAAKDLTGAELLDLLAELDAELDTPVSILIAGGAALAIRWGVRRTSDIDAVSDDLTPEVRRAVARVGERRGVGADWLNDGAKGFAPRLPAASQPAFIGNRLSVYSPSAEYILAMKLVSGRDDDMGDIRFLMGETGLSHGTSCCGWCRTRTRISGFRYLSSI
ncbi:MAG: DUF6036 family nucleotidyltransferase [bacterium]|nr:DUF6036 family nucleotidyltransferase [bacterium]